MHARIRKRTLIRIFLYAGATSFGGWSTAAVWFREELVERRKVLSAREVQDVIAYAQILPGPTQVEIASGLGYLLRGRRGSLVAVIAYVLPVTILMIGFAFAYGHLAARVELRSAFNGLFPALAGIIVANAYKIGQGLVRQTQVWGLVLLAALLHELAHVHPALIILGYGLIAAAWMRVQIYQKERHA